MHFNPDAVFAAAKRVTTDEDHERQDEAGGSLQSAVTQPHHGSKACRHGSWEEMPSHRALDQLLHRQGGSVQQMQTFGLDAADVKTPHHGILVQHHHSDERDDEVKKPRHVHVQAAIIPPSPQRKGLVRKATFDHTKKSVNSGTGILNHVISEEEAFERAIAFEKEVEKELSPVPDDARSRSSRSSCSGFSSDADDAAEPAAPGAQDQDEDEDSESDSEVLKGAEEIRLQDELMKMPIFETCCQAFIERLAKTVISKSFYPGEEIVRDHTEGVSLLAVRKGAVQMYIDTDKVGRLTEGQYIGEMMLLGLENLMPVRLQADPKLEKEITLCEITRDRFLEALLNFPEESHKFEMIRHAHMYSYSEGTMVHTWDPFKGLSDKTLIVVDSRVMTRLYFPGERIITEGTPSGDLYILAKGWLSIELNGRKIREENRGSDPKEASQPVVLGELGLLGIQSRHGSSAVARSVCRIRILHHSVFVNTLRDSGETLQLKGLSMIQKAQANDHDGHTAVTKSLKGISIFQRIGSSDQFLNFLTEHLEDRIYLAHQKIIDDSKACDRCLYVLRQGHVKVVKDGNIIAKLSGEVVFGELTVLGLASKRSASVIATSMCYAQALSQDIFLRGLELFPAERDKVLAVAQDNVLEPGVAQKKMEDMPPAPPKRQDSGADGEKPAQKKSPFRQNAIDKVVRECALFTETHPQFAAEVRNRAKERIYMPGDFIIEEGMKGESMFVMLHGEATIFVTKQIAKSRKRGSIVDANGEDGEPSSNSEEQQGPQHGVMGLVITKQVFDPSQAQRVGALLPGAVAGELAMLGISQFRTATIQALTICFAWELTLKDAMAIFERLPEVRDHFAKAVLKNLEHTVDKLVLGLPMFQAFDRRFLFEIVMHCQRRAYFTRQTIAKEGHTSEGLYIINFGQAVLSRCGYQIQLLSSGGHFGTRCMLGIRKKSTCTLSAQSTCHVVIIGRETYARAFQAFPSLAAEKELRHNAEAAERQLHSALSQSVNRNRAWRSQKEDTEGLRNKRSAALFSQVYQQSDVELLRRCFFPWKARSVAAWKRRRAVAAREFELMQHSLRSQRIRQAAGPRVDLDPVLAQRGPILPTPRGSSRGDGTGGQLNLTAPAALGSQQGLWAGLGLATPRRSPRRLGAVDSDTDYGHYARLISMQRTGARRLLASTLDQGFLDEDEAFMQRVNRVLKPIADSSSAKSSGQAAAFVPSHDLLASALAAPAFRPSELPALRT